VCCSVLLCVAVCCRVLLCVAVCCRVLQCVAVCCSVLPCVTVRCRVLQCVAVCCSVADGSENGLAQAACTLLHCVLQCVAVCCNVLQCVAVCCGVCCSVRQQLQCVAICCSVLQPSPFLIRTQTYTRRHSWKFGQAVAKKWWKLPCVIGCWVWQRLCVRAAVA